MAVYTFNFKKVQPSTGGGGRQPYIKPGKYRLKVTAYSDKSAASGKEMHTFTSTVLGKGPESGKTIIDRFAMPKTAKESQFPLERLLAFFMALGSKTAQGREMKLDPARLVGKEYDALIGDVLEDARTVDGTTYPARTVSNITKYIFDGDEDEEDSDDDDEDEDEDEEEEDSDDEEDEEDEDEEEEEEEPAPKKKASKKAPAKTSKKSKKSSDDSFPFD